MGSFRSYVADVRRDAGSALSTAALLVAAGALLEGVGIVAILPFAALITGQADTDAARSILGFMDHAGLSGEWERALALSIGFLIILALRSVVVWKRDTALFQLGLRYVDNWRSTLFRAIADARWSAVSELRRTDIEHSITNDVMRLSTGTDRLLRACAALALVVVQLAIVALLAPLLLLLVLVLIGLAALVTLPLLRKADALGQRLTQSGRKIHRVLGDFLSSQKLARLNNAESEFLDRFDISVSAVRAHQSEFFASQTAARGWFQFAAGCMVIAALLIGFFLLETPVSVLAVTLLVLARLVAPILLLAQTGQSLANTLPAFDALQTTLVKLNGAAQIAPKLSCHPRPDGPAALKLSDISFSYPGQDAAVLSGVNLEIKPGEMVALSATSGAGKTTLLDIVGGLHAPHSGAIAVDGRPMREAADLRLWRSQLAYLPQDPFLFDSSLRENLMWSTDHADEERIAQALEAAQIAKFVEKLPNGLESRTGERGQNLSGGERQRVCIARALLRRPRLLILDEATSAIDAGIEAKVLGNISAMRDQFSVLFVTHRAEALRHADRVFTLSDGKMAEK